LSSKTTDKIGWRTAAGLVLSNMIGTGVFTSLGFQVVHTQNTWSIIILWTLGGFIGLIGAFTYAELGTHFKESGGDYIFLSRLIHPFAGYIYAWISLIIGFAAPIAIAAMAMTSYLSGFGGGIFNNWFGIGVILILTAVHSVSIRQSGLFQDVSTLIKLIFVIVLIVIGIIYLPPVDNALDFNGGWGKELIMPGFAVSLIYVTYAFTGWNSAAYIVDEIDDPRKNLPKALILGVLICVVLYVLLQLVFLKHASLSQLEGNVEVATIAFNNIFNEGGAHWVSIFIAIQLLATISGYLWVGSRITFALAKENSLWRILASKNAKGIPVRALWAQGIIAALLTLTGTFEQVMLYASFVLQLMGTLTIISIFWLKPKAENFKSPFRPFLQIIYILFSIWVLGFMLYEQPYESAIGLLIVLAGGISYLFNKQTIAST